MAGVKAFREAYVSAGTLGDSTFGSFDARGLRYALLWSFYENTQYRDIHTWATKLRADYGLYKHVRGIYNPAYRLGDFWQSHLWGGLLDPSAGDGKQMPSALPISIPDTNPRADPLRAAIATLWRDSNWQVNKDVTTLSGSILGDIALRIVDDVDRGKVYLSVVHPGTLADLDLDDFGNVKGYIVEETRPDPQRDDTAKTVIYREVAERDGENVVYTTYLNGTPYAWNGVTPEWAEAYGFIPLVFIKHNDVGQDWGWSELHPALGKIREADDLASKLHDQIRKLVDAPWLFSGVSKPGTKPQVTGETATTTKPEPGREEIPALYGPAGATATPLVAPLDIVGTTAEIKELLAEIERDYPELGADRLVTASGDASGRALRVARQPIETKVQKRRPNYDNALVRAQQMAIAIGGYRGYPGYKGFGLDSYAAGDLAHAIDNRPVFSKDPLDDLELKKEFWTVVQMATANGDVPTETVLRDLGWTDEQIAKSGMRERTQQEVIPDGDQ